MNEEKNIENKIITVSELLQNSNLQIPIYQRPYKWSIKNVNQLIKDIVKQQIEKKSAYRLGTIVIHKDENNIENIVDGQQRTVTLLLIVTAIFNNEIIIENPQLKKQVADLENNLLNFKFANEISTTNIKTNYNEIARQTIKFNENTIDFLLNKCEFIQFVLTDISEAFQFFDSQNARGKDLEPHDLLKAFHLREFNTTDEQQMSEVIDTWESMNTKELANLFGEYLYRIRNWTKGNSARYFTKNEVPLFKGINVDKIGNYPYTQFIRIAHHYIDEYNSQYQRKIDFNTTAFPFQLDQTIINGRRFFEMISHYKHIFDDFTKNINFLDENSKKIFDIINHYDGQHRTGDQYVRMLFNTSLVYYIDKFGKEELSNVIEKLFVWAYTVRLKYQAVQLASIDNYVVETRNIFKRIKDATKPADVLMVHLPTVTGNKSTKTEKIVKLFETLKHYETAE
ncbi:MAG TPA: DUF262 domain-containing protein [Bacteroidia bacterium]|nr:DUF262 domain-containing protein [Bacteroidia bacterium]